MILDLEMRRRIYECIEQNPGIHFREIQRRTNIAIGSLDYHIHYLHRHGLIRLEKDRKYVRYYALTKNWEDEEREILSLLRQEKVRRILVYMLQKKTANPQDISGVLGIQSSTLSWYLKNLSTRGVIRYVKRGRQRLYSVNNPENIVKYLIAHKTSFFDEMVDRFIETWTE
jgi:predicted transcriptional regulator